MMFFLYRSSRLGSWPLLHPSSLIHSESTDVCTSLCSWGELSFQVLYWALCESVCEVNNNWSCSSLTFYSTGYFCCATEMCDVRQDKHIYIEIIKDRTSLSLPHCVGLHPIWMLQLSDRMTGHKPGCCPRFSPLIWAATLPNKINSEMKGKGFLRWMQKLLRQNQKPPLQ